MKKKSCIVLCFVVLASLFSLACSAVNTPPTIAQAQTPPPDKSAEGDAYTPPTLVSGRLSYLLSDASGYCDGGLYAYAISNYWNALELDPQNYDANVGLGKAYRKTKQPDKALAPLQYAMELYPYDNDIMLELGYAYLDMGEYTEAESLALKVLDGQMPNLGVSYAQIDATPPFETISGAQGDAMTLLLLSLGARMQVEEVRVLMRDQALGLYLLLRSDSNAYAMEENYIIYAGEYNADGQREGQGVGIYGTGDVYIGEYKNNERSGQGSLVFDYGYFTGEWADDAPNGYGELYLEHKRLEEDGSISSNDLIERITGNYVNGLEHGEMNYYDASYYSSLGLCKQPHPFTSVNGKRAVYDFEIEKGETIKVFVHCDHFMIGDKKSGWAIPWDENDIRGVPGWPRPEKAPEETRKETLMTKEEFLLYITTHNTDIDPSVFEKSNIDIAHFILANGYISGQEFIKGHSFKDDFTLYIRNFWADRYYDPYKARELKIVESTEAEYAAFKELFFSKIEKTPTYLGADEYGIDDYRLGTERSPYYNPFYMGRSQILENCDIELGSDGVYYVVRPAGEMQSKESITYSKNAKYFILASPYDDDLCDFVRIFCEMDD